MASGKINAIKQYNEDLVTSYVDNYREVDQMHGAYDNYAMMILDWAGNRDLMKAPQFRIDFRKYLDARAREKGKDYSDNYIYSACLFVRDFFRYCKAELPADDTALITDYWLQNLVPNRKTAKRISFSWLSDEDLKKSSIISRIRFASKGRKCRSCWLQLPVCHELQFFPFPFGK